MNNNLPPAPWKAEFSDGDWCVRDANGIIMCWATRHDQDICEHIALWRNAEDVMKLPTPPLTQTDLDALREAYPLCQRTRLLVEEIERLKKDRTEMLRWNSELSEHLMDRPNWGIEE